MKDVYLRWAAGLLGCVLMLLALCGAVVYYVDPCLYYRMPERWQPVFFNERYQAAGVIKHVEADTVILGTSMTANYHAGRGAELFGGTAVRITLPDGYFSEFDSAVDLLFREQSPERIVFGLDPNILIRDGSGVTGAMPDYLYNQDPVDDMKYLLNKDTLYYSLYVLLANRWGGGQTVEEGFIWDDGTVWERYEALRTYRRPDLAEEQLPEDAYFSQTDENLAVMETWFQEHPETEFDVFFPPYSILYWDRMTRKGELEARFASIARAAERLLAYENVKVYAPIFNKEIVTDLDRYCDYIHHSPETCTEVLREIASDEYRLTWENLPTVLESWHKYVTDYDYDSIWDQTFLDRWMESHDAPPVWWEW